MIADELRALAAGAIPGAIVPKAEHVRDVCTRAADRLEQLERAELGPDQLPRDLDELGLDPWPLHRPTTVNILVDLPRNRTYVVGGPSTRLVTLGDASVGRQLDTIDWWSEGIQHLKNLVHALDMSITAPPRVIKAYQPAARWLDDTEAIRRERPDGRKRESGEPS